VVSIDNLGELAFFGNSTASTAEITNDSSSTFALLFASNSTAAASIIINSGNATFGDNSSAGTATITNNFTLNFNVNGSAANANITNNGFLGFADFSNAGSAQLNNNDGGAVDFSGSAGPASNHQLTVGSIAGAGTYLLGGDQLTVGLNGLSTQPRSIQPDLQAAHLIPVPPKGVGIADPLSGTAKDRKRGAFRQRFRFSLSWVRAGRHHRSPQPAFRARRQCDLQLLPPHAFGHNRLDHDHLQ
jgi:hypothetical protein